MTIIDHLFFLAIAVAFPIASYSSFQKLLRRIEAGEKISRAYIYNMTLRSHWLLFGIAIAIWAASGRSWASLGFGLELDIPFLIGIALTLAVLAGLAVQLRRLADASEKDIDSYRQRLGRLEFMFPRNGNELNRFYGLSMTAGIVEETLWRGFLFWYLGHFIPLWGAAIVSSVGFGLAHLYQGVRNVPQIILVGGALSALYLITGSLWLPILLHAVFDMVQGQVVYRIARRAPAAA
jgi:membrane protease YdiL (CAAX protease family)